MTRRSTKPSTRPGRHIVYSGKVIIGEVGYAEKPKRIPPTFTKGRGFPSRQLGELRAVVEARGGLDDADDSEILLLAAAHLLRWRMDGDTPRVEAEPLAFALARWCDDVTGERPSQSYLLAVAKIAVRKPRYLTPKWLGEFIGLKFDERVALGISTINAADVTPAEQKRRMKERHKTQKREWQKEWRRARGMKPQSESMSRQRPWITAGLSRSAWYRRRKTNGGTKMWTSNLSSLS